MDTSKDYNDVADLYDETFSSIKPRRKELKWLMQRIPGKVRVLDIGCGNGALLREISNSRKEISGVGIDTSDKLLKKARERSAGYPLLSFIVIADKNMLEFPDSYFDVTISMLSFRYIERTKILPEMLRVTKKNGKILIVDMVESDLKLLQIPKLVLNKLDAMLTKLLYPQFSNNLKTLVASPFWRNMLKRHPIRSRAEYDKLFKQNGLFPSIQILDIGLKAQIVAYEIRK